jgi:anti-anti-sigma factor
MNRESVTEAELRVDSSFDDEVVGLHLSGSADTRSMESLGKVVSRAASEAKRPGVREVVVDLRELDFMNSSCFKHFVTWICAVQEEGAAGRGRHFRFRSDPTRLWQRRSLHALHGLAAELVTIES